MSAQKPSAARPRRYALLLAILALSIAVGGATWFYIKPQGSYPDLERAKAALDNEDLALAEEQLQSLVAHTPANAEGRFLLARTLRREGKLAEAKQQLAEAERLHWNHQQVREEQSLAVMQRDAPLRSREGLLSVVNEGQLPPTLLLEALYRGDLQAKDRNRAGLWLHLWLKKEPEAWLPRLWQAELLEHSSTYDRALADYQKVLEARPGQPRALRGVGLCALRNRADYDVAERFLRQYLEHQPDDPDAQLGLARCFYGRSDAAAAREAALKIIAAHPRHADTALLLGTIESEEGHDQEALQWARLAEEEHADTMPVSYLLSQVLRHLGDETEADKYHRQFTKIRDIRREMEALSQRELDIAPTADKWHHLGLLALELDDEEMAVKCFGRALGLDPKHAPSHAALADCFSRQTGDHARVQAEVHRRQAMSSSETP